MFRHALETASSLQRWQAIPIASHLNSTASRWWRNTPIACQTEWITPRPRPQCVRTTAGPWRPLRRRAVPVGCEEGIAVLGGRHEGLLDRPRAHPADQVPHRPGLVV